jgi:hypothetical protein
MFLPPKAILFDVKICQRDDVTFWIFPEAYPEVLDWLEKDCAWAFWLKPKVEIVGHAMGSQFESKEFAKEVTFVDKGGALEFKLRWYKNV